jgi:hypothetical protein
MQLTMCNRRHNVTRPSRVETGGQRGNAAAIQMNDEIRKLKAERDRWRAEYERAASQRDYLIRFLGGLAEAVAEGNYVKVQEIDGGPAVNIIARYPRLYAGLRAAEGLQTLRRMFRLDRLADATGLRELKIDIDVSR